MQGIAATSGQLYLRTGLVQSTPALDPICCLAHVNLANCNFSQLFCAVWLHSTNCVIQQKNADTDLC